MTAQYADLWRVEAPRGGNPLPLMPVFRRKTTESQDNWWRLMFTTFRAKAEDREYLCIGGINFACIPDFCGGNMVTSFNVKVAPWQRSYMMREQIEDYDNMPSVEDFYGDDWMSLMGRYIEKPAEVYRYTRSNYPDAIKALESLVTASVMARLMLTGAPYNQNITSFWDRRDGTTRRLLAWGHTMLRAGVEAPEGYCAQQISNNARFGTRHNVQSGYQTWPNYWDGSYPRAYPSGFFNGKFRRNDNSGIQCSNGVFMTRDFRTKNTPQRGFTRINIRLSPRWNHISSGNHVDSIAAIPDEWHPM